MLKITQQDAPDATTLWLEGRLTVPWIGELERVCAGLDARRVQLDLSGLAFVDEAGVAALERLLGGRVTCIGASSLVRELLGDAAGARAPRDLLERLRAGDPAAFEELVRTHGGRMLATARRLLGDDAAAGRVVQSAFAAVFESLERCQSAELGSQLMDRTVRAALAELHTRRARGSITALLPHFTRHGSRVNDEADELAQGFGAALENPSPAVEARVRACVEQLPEPFRAVLLLCDVEGYGLEDAATLLELELGETRARLHHSRQALRLLLGRALRAEQAPAHAQRPLSA